MNNDEKNDGREREQHHVWFSQVWQLHSPLGHAGQPAAQVVRR